MKHKEGLALFYLLLVLSCTNNGGITGGQQDVVSIIKSYIDNDTVYHPSYLICSTDSFLFMNEKAKVKGLFIAPLYRNPYKKGTRSYVPFLSYQGKKVYWEVYNNKKVRNVDSNIVFCDNDSCVLYGNTYTTDYYFNYLRRAIVITYTDGRINVMHHIDTLILPTIKPDAPVRGTYHKYVKRTTSNRLKGGAVAKLTKRAKNEMSNEEKDKE